MITRRQMFKMVAGLIPVALIGKKSPVAPFKAQVDDTLKKFRMIYNPETQRIILTDIVGNIICPGIDWNDCKLKSNPK